MGVGVIGSEPMVRRTYRECAASWMAGNNGLAKECGACSEGREETAAPSCTRVSTQEQQEACSKACSPSAG